MIETLPIFIKHLHRAVQEIESQLQFQQWDVMQRTAHNLKGSSASYGFPILVDAVKELEAEAKYLRDPINIRKILQDISDLTIRVELGLGG